VTARPRMGTAVPPRRLVIGCDGSDGADDAIGLARLLAGEEASFLLVDVAPRSTLGRHFGEHRPADFSICCHALEASTRPAAVDTRTVRADSPAEVLADVAGDERHDLIVVGSPHRGLLGRALLGSVAKSLLHCSPVPVPVAIAPRGFAGAERPNRIAVGFDGTHEAESALDWAEGFAAAHGAELDVFVVATPPVSIPGALGYRPPGPAEPFEALEDAVDRVAEGTRIHAHLLVGPAAPNLSAATSTADLLVVGTQSHDALEEALIGSVADALVTAPRCPVVAVPLRSRPSPDRRSDHDGEAAPATEDARA